MSSHTLGVCHIVTAGVAHSRRAYCDTDQELKSSHCEA